MTPAGPDTGCSGYNRRSDRCRRNARACDMRARSVRGRAHKKCTKNARVHGYSTAEHRTGSIRRRVVQLYSITGSTVLTRVRMRAGETRQWECEVVGGAAEERSRAAALPLVRRGPRAQAVDVNEVNGADKREWPRAGGDGAGP